MCQGDSSRPHGINLLLVRFDSWLLLFQLTAHSSAILAQPPAQRVAKVSQYPKSEEETPPSSTHQQVVMSLPLKFIYLEADISVKG